MIRVVLDANVIISGIIAPLGASAAILDAWQAEYIEVVTCPGLIGEVAEKLALPRIRDKYGLTDAEVRTSSSDFHRPPALCLAKCLYRRHRPTQMTRWSSQPPLRPTLGMW
jgi:predicted nucleic acid-binding protein